jgi:hypothetical protein
MESSNLGSPSFNSEVPHPNSDSAITSTAPTAPQPAGRSLRLIYYNAAQDVRDKLVAHHGAMIKPDAKVTYKDNGKDVQRDLTPRETMRHMKELLFFSQLNLSQQKIDAKIAAKEDQKFNSLNAYVTETVRTAGEILHQEALAQGLRCIAELPRERVHQVYEEEKKKYDEEHPPQTEPGCKKPFEIPAEQRNDWFIPEETQITLMNRLIDMASPDGVEYQTLKPRDRVMASRLFGRFCLVGQQQLLIDMRRHDQKPDLDEEECCKEIEKLTAEAIEFNARDDEEFYKTHPRGGRSWPPRPKTEDPL